jgi:HupE / UreJ protein
MRMPVFLRSWLLTMTMMLFTAAASAHEMRPAYLELRERAANTYDVLWKVPAAGEDLRLALYVHLPSSCTNLSEPHGAFIAGAYSERWRMTALHGLAGERITIDGLSSTSTDVLVRLNRLDGTSQVVRLLPSEPSFVVTASPGGWDVVRTYSRLGFEHILLGVDHLLFVLGLLLIVRGPLQLFKTITSFTFAHSLTLAVATLGYASAPPLLLNALIALSILFLGPEIVRSWRGGTSLAIRQPWVVAFAFGLLHGFAFASGLSVTGLPASAIPPALLCFNLGVEAGQLAFVGLVLVMLRAFQALEMRWPLWITRAPGYVVGVCGVFWTIQRTAMLFAGT